MPSAPPRTSRSGCLIAVYIMLGLGALVLVAGGIGVWLFLRSERGQNVMKMAREGMTLAREAASAPGTAELRAAGCSQAMVMSSARMRDLIGDVPAQGDDGKASASTTQTMLFCQLATSDGVGPDCGEIARAYAKAVPDAPERISVVVRGAGIGGNRCQGVFARDGVLVEPLERE
jgi:hypothetical protein